jgi:iron(III) transport system permease protein
MRTLDVTAQPEGGFDQPSRTRRRFTRPSGRTVATVLISAALIYLVAGPVAVLVFGSFKDTTFYLPFESGAPWSLTNFQQVFGSAATYQALGNTVVFALGSLALSFGVSVALALLVERTDIPFRKIIYIAVIAQMGIPAIISAVGWDLLLSPRVGYVNIAIRGVFGLGGQGPFNVYSMLGMICVQSINLVPVTFLLLSAAFRAMDASLEDAAISCGATRLTTMRKITLPLLTPALLSAAVYQLVAVIVTLDIPLLIGLPAREPVLSILVYLQVQDTGGGLPNYGLACVYSILVVALVLAPLLYYNRIIARASRYRTVSGKGYRPRRHSLGRMKPFAMLGVSLFLVVSAVLPIGALVWTSLEPYPSAFSRAAFARLTFGNFTSLFETSGFLNAVGNTILVGGCAAIGTMTLGLLVGWVIVRGRPRRWARTVDVLAFIPHVAPGVIVALTVLLIYLFVPIPIYETVWIIVVAIITQEISLSTRLMSGALAQIDDELEDAGAASGARWRHVLARITLPLTSRPFINGLLLVFLLAIKNLTLPLILYGPSSNVLATLIWTSYEAGTLVQASAIGVCLVALALVVIALVRRFGDVAGVQE